MKKVLVTGSNGMLGQDLTSTLEQRGYSVIPTDVDTLDITDKYAVKNFFEDNVFDIVFHTAAYTDVDKSESKKSIALKINAKGTENLARYSAKKGLPILYISTDYVFDGTKNIPYETFDKAKSY